MTPTRLMLPSRFSAAWLASEPMATLIAGMVLDSFAQQQAAFKPVPERLR